MRVALLASDADVELASALAEAGVEVEPVDVAAGPGPVSALAAGLRGAQAAIAGDPPAAMVVTGTGDEALGAALTAVKLGVPSVWVRPGEADPDALLSRVVDLTLDATSDARAIVSAVREFGAPRISAP